MNVDVDVGRYYCWNNNLFLLFIWVFYSELIVWSVRSASRHALVPFVAGTFSLPVEGREGEGRSHFELIHHRPNCLFVRIADQINTVRRTHPT